MDAFSYLSVLLSIIIGLAITQVLQGYRALLLAKARVRSDGTALLWSVSLLLFATQAWWASFGLREHREWSFLAFAIVLLQMILLYMMSAVVLPDVGDEQEIDLSEHFAEHRKLFFGILLAMLGASVLKDFILTGGLPTPTNLLFHVIFATAQSSRCWRPTAGCSSASPWWPHSASESISRCCSAASEGVDA